MTDAMMYEDIYTTAEIEMATGLPRGTITTRAKLLGYERDGRGYTAQQVYSIVTYLHELHRKSDVQATKLRKELNNMLTANNMPILIEVNDEGKWSVRQFAETEEQRAARTAKEEKQPPRGTYRGRVKHK